MAITIKLDAPALRALIGDNPEFELELQRSVTAEVMRNFLLRDAAAVKAAAQEMLADVVLTRQDPTKWGTPLILRDHAVKEVKKAVEEQSRVLIREAAEKAIAEMSAWVATQLDARVGAAIAMNFDKQVQAAIDQRLAALKASL